MRAAEEDEAFAGFSQNSRRLARDVELRLANLTQLASTGAGLGLTICREIVAAHRGSISARNRPEGGAVFEIMVPR